MVSIVASCGPPERDMPCRLDRGTLRLLLTDKPLDGNVEEVLVTISRVDLVYADPQQPIVSITPTRTSFDLLALRDGVTEELGFAALPSGALSQIRLIIDHAAITVDGRTGPLRIPSGPQTGIKLNGEVAIDPCTSVTVLLDFDAERSLHHAPGLARGEASGYVLKPVIAMRSVVTDRDQQAPAIAVAEDGVITETESMAFHVAMQDPSGIDQASFAAELNGVDVSDRFMLNAGSAQSLELGLDRLGVNRLEVSVADACGNRARAIARVYRAAPGQKPEAFGVIGETGGRVEVDAAGSSIAGAEVVVPAGALPGAAVITLGLAPQTSGRPAGRTAVGPALRVSSSEPFLSEVRVILPFSRHLIAYLRGQAGGVEVWRQAGMQAWQRVAGESPAGRERVEVATRQLSTLQVWFEYPEHLVLDTIAGGGQRAIDAGGRDLGRRVALESPLGVDGLAGVSGEVLLLTEYWGTRIDRLSKTTGLLTNIKSAEASPNGGETHYTAVMGALQPYCGGSWMCLYYAVEHRIEDPYSGSFATQVQIRRTDLSGVSEEVIAGRLGGDDGEGVAALDAALGRVFGLELDPHGDLLLLETAPALSSLPGGEVQAGGNRVRRIDRDSGTINTIAGTGVAGYNGDAGPAVELQLDLPAASHLELMHLHEALLFVADWKNHRVRAVNVGDETVVLGPQAAAPVDIEPGEMVTVLGLLGEPVEASCEQVLDGALGTDTRLVRPTGLAVGDGYLFAADECDRIVMMSLEDLRVTTVAGTPGQSGYSGEGLPGIDSRLHRPQGLHYDRHRKELVVAEFYNNRVRRLHYRWRIFVRPNGCSVENDESCLEDGGTYSYPVGSINDALAIIKFVKEREDPPPDDDIEVVFMPAVSNIYYGQPVDWTYTMPEHSITFRPLDPNDPPIFAGCDPAAPCFDRGYEQHCRSCEDYPDEAGCPCDAQQRQENLARCHCAGGDRRRAEEWFEYRLPDGGPGQRTNLVFDRLIVTGYQDGIGLRGQFEDDDFWVGSNSITNCIFHDLGDGAIEDFENPDPEKRGTPRSGWAGVALANSRNNVVVGNTFDTLSNDYNIYEGGDTELYMHGVYLLWYANDNLVADNVFKRISGDPIRVRDFSNFNTISNNLFSRSGYEAAYGEWYCNFEQFEPDHCTKDPPEDVRECPSYENRFTDNILDGRFSREPAGCRPLAAVYKAFELQPGSDYLQACCESPNNPWSLLPCEPAGQWNRVEEAGNVSTGGACACLADEVQTVDDCRSLIGL
jgi:hypothetical protein